MRSITVKGTGSVTAKPDFIVINFQLEAKDKDYEVMMRLASEQIDAVNLALAQVGFDKGDLKTTNFNVQTEHESIRDKNGNYKQLFSGYSCRHQMKLSFDFDSHRLGSTLSAIASATVDPQLSISFTVKNPNEISEALLRDATVNARKKAEILCEASNVELGQLMSIDYNWGELNVYSDTRYLMEDRCMAMPIGAANAFDADIDPDDIKVNDTATFVWQIR